MKRADIFKVEYSELEVEDGFNIRYDYGDIEALALSIKENGVKNPLRGYKTKENKFVITDGHRRYKGIGRAIELGADPKMDIPFLPDGKGDTFDRTLGMVVYNDGKKLTLLEEALVYKRLVEDGMKQAEIASRTGKTGTHISNLIMLSKTPESLQKRIRDGKISPSLVIEELKKKSPEEFTQEVEEVLEKNDDKKISNKDLKTPKQKSIDFLVEKGLMDKKAKKFIITMNDDTGTEYDLVELMVEFKKRK